MTNNIEDRMPIWEVAADHIISKLGDTTIVFAVTKPEIFSMSFNEMEMQHKAWVRALEVLGPGTVIHMQDWYWQTTWKGDVSKPDRSFLGDASERYYNGRPWLEHRSYLYISQKPAQRNRPGGTGLARRSLTPPDTLSQQAVEAFEARVSQFQRILTDSKLLQCHRLHNEELASSQERAGIIEQYCQLIMPGEAPVLRDLDFEKGFRIGNRHCLLHTIADAQHLPAECSFSSNYTPYSNDRSPFYIGFGSSLGLLLPVNHIYNQYIYIEDPQATKKKLELKGRRMQSLAPHSRENALGKAAVDEFMDEAITGHKLMVKACFYIQSWTEEPADLPALNNQVVSAIARLGASPHQETVGTAQLWCAGIPGNSADLPFYELFDSFAEQVCCLLIPDSNYLTAFSQSDLRLGDRLCGRPLNIDLSDLPMRSRLIKNRNKFILGGSG